MNHDMTQYKDAGLNLLASVADFVTTFRQESERVLPSRINVVDDTTSWETDGEREVAVVNLNAQLNKLDYTTITIDAEKNAIWSSSSVKSDSNNNRSWNTVGANVYIPPVFVNEGRQTEYFNLAVGASPNFPVGQYTPTKSDSIPISVRACSTPASDMRTTVWRGYPKPPPSFYVQNQTCTYAGPKISQTYEPASVGTGATGNGGAAYGGPLVGHSLSFGEKRETSLPNPNCNWPCPNPAMSAGKKPLPAHLETLSALPNIIKYGYWDSFPRFPVGSPAAEFENMLSECYMGAVMFFIPWVDATKFRNASRTWARNYMERNQARHSLPLDLSPKAKAPIPQGTYQVCTETISDDENDEYSRPEYAPSAFAAVKSFDARHRVRGLMLASKPIYMRRMRVSKAVVPYKRTFKPKVKIQHPRALTYPGFETYKEVALSADEELAKYVNDNIINSLEDMKDFETD
ncbi:unnamed protein product [Orchesella dallaii]|uniref:Uncharacterized protein n=1 Tax=Orchesella dallaii TaxID=48710 RepID=A0ABP1RL07_9HEXA